MIVCLLTFSGDVLKAKNLLQWIARLGKVNTQILLVVDRVTPFERVVECSSVAVEAFTEFHIAVTEETVMGWPAGPYALFRTACEAVMKRFNEPFLLMEPDAIPLRPGWFEVIKAEYDKAKYGHVPFLGHIYEGTENFIGEKFMSGIGVYPADTAKRLKFSETPVHWDVHHRQEIVANATHTGLIKHFFGQIDLAPKFVDGPRQAINEFNPSWIGNDAVIFHRDKTQSLIPLLRRQLFPQDNPSLKVVFPVHGGDIAQATHHAKWLRQLSAGQPWRNEAVVAFDKTCPIVPLNAFQSVLRQSFVTVTDLCYERPPFPGYPMAANWAFQNVAWQMSRQKSPWLWCEADAVALRRDWLDRLSLEYEICGRAFMGSIVPHMGHIQGTAVYPPDAAERMPRAMSCSAEAFDMAGHLDIPGEDRMDSKLFCHCWSLAEGRFHPVGGGAMPVGFTAELCAQIPKEAVFFHRVKDNSLVDLLMSGWRP